jgi:hypothetical protein
VPERKPHICELSYPATMDLTDIFDKIGANLQNINGNQIINAEKCCF